MLALIVLASTLALATQASILPPVAKEVVKRNSDGTDCDTGSWKWSETETVFAFGDSYTQESFNSTTLTNGATSANGPNWIQDLTEVYNISSPISRFNVAFAGANIDQDIITGYSPTIKSVKDQVAEFEAYVATGATWDQQKAMCVMWIGINDIGQTYKFTNVSLSDLYQTERDRLLALSTQIQSHDTCAAWLFLTVPPINLAPGFNGPDQVDLVSYAVETWNAGLYDMAGKFQEENNGTWVGVFDTGRVFNTVYDNADALGFVNKTGFNPLYPVDYVHKQVRGNNSQIEPFPPMSSYFWLDNAHPSWPIHNILAHAVATFLAAVHVG